MHNLFSDFSKDIKIRFGYKNPDFDLTEETHPSLQTCRDRFLAAR